MKLSLIAHIPPVWDIKSNDEDTLDRERFSKGSALQTRRLPTNHDPKPDYKGRQPESASELGGSQDSYSSMEPPAEFAAQYHADAVLMHLAREAFDLLLLYLDHHVQTLNAIQLHCVGSSSYLLSGAQSIVDTGSSCVDFSALNIKKGKVRNSLTQISLRFITYQSFRKLHTAMRNASS